MTAVKTATSKTVPMPASVPAAAIVPAKPSAADVSAAAAAAYERGTVSREVARTAADAAAVEAFSATLDDVRFSSLTDAAAVHGKNARFGRFAVVLKRGSVELARVHVPATRTQFWMDRLMGVATPADGGEMVYTPATPADKERGHVCAVRTYDGVHLYKANAAGSAIPRKITLQTWFNQLAKPAINAAIFTAVDRGTFTAARNVSYSVRLVKDHSEA